MSEDEVAKLRKELDGIKVRSGWDDPAFLGLLLLRRNVSRLRGGLLLSPPSDRPSGRAPGAQPACEKLRRGAPNRPARPAPSPPPPRAQVRGRAPPRPIRTWHQAGLYSRVLEAMLKGGFERPLPIQAQVRARCAAERARAVRSRQPRAAALDARVAA